MPGWLRVLVLVLVHLIAGVVLIFSHGTSLTHHVDDDVVFV